MTRRLLHVSLDDPEVEGFYIAASKRHLASWTLNDANWRSEYMDKLLEALGFEVLSSTDPAVLGDLARRWDNFYRGLEP